MKINSIKFLNRKTTSNKTNKINNINSNSNFTSNSIKMNSLPADSVHFTSIDRYFQAEPYNLDVEDFIPSTKPDVEDRPIPVTEWGSGLETKFQNMKRNSPYEWARDYDITARDEYYRYLINMVDYKSSSIFFNSKDLEKKLKICEDFRIEALTALAYLQNAERLGREPFVDTNFTKAIRDKYVACCATIKQNEALNRNIINPYGRFADKIAGYDAQVSRLMNGYVRYVNLERYNKSAYLQKVAMKDRYTKEELDKARFEAKNVPIPPAILIYGPNNVGKSAFIAAMANEAGAKVSKYSPLSGDDIDKFLAGAINSAVFDSWYSGERTIYVIEEPEKYFYKSDDSKLWGRAENLRSMLKYCAHDSIQRDDFPAPAATFVLVTQNPSKLRDIGLIENEEKIPIILSIPPAENENLEEVIRFNLKRIDPKDGIFSVDDYDCSKIVKKLSPSARGAYSNEKIKLIFDEIAEEYVNRKNVPFQVCLEEGILNERCRTVKHRDISPAELANYRKEFEEIGER